jgi:hypothetical protein
VFMPRITEHGYGVFPGGDPRRFSPDGDSTPTELENHRLACAAWDAGEQTSSPDCIHAPGVILTRCQFGFGSYSYEEDVSLWEWARHYVAPKVGWWLWWRLPHRVQDWKIERERRASVRRFKEGA